MSPADATQPGPPPAALWRTLDALPHAVWTAAPDGTLEAVNGHWRRYSGLDLAATRDGGWRAVFHPDDAPRIDALWADSRRDGAARTAECRLRRAADGSWRRHLWSVAPVRDARGALVRWIGTCTDVDGHREAEARAGAATVEVARLNTDLSHRLAELQALVEVMPVGIEISDGTPARRATRCVANPALAKLIGVPAGSNLAPPDGDLSYSGPLPFTIRAGGIEGPPVPVEQMPTRRAELTGEEVRGAELTVVRADGGAVELLGYASPLLGEGGVVRGAVGVYLDVSGRKRGEAAARRAAEQAERDRAAAEAARESAEAANQAKDRFLAMLSHELRTPLTPVLTAVDGLLADLADRPDAAPDELAASLEMVRRNVELEARLIDDLLDLTKISRGKLRLERRPCDAHELIAGVIQMCRAEAEFAGTEVAAVSIDLSAGRATVDADPARLQQVLWNLVKNAMKFTPPEGSITVRTSNVGSVDGASTAPWLRVEVIDTGVGLEAEAIPRIFFAFEQVEQRNPRGARLAGGGLGLGLAISRSLVDMHGGRLRVRSDGPGRGATFTAELECAAEGVVASAPVPIPSDNATPPAPIDGSRDGSMDGSAAAKRRILLVDDHGDTNRAMKRLLSRLGYDVTTAATVAEALAADESAGPFDLLLSDIGLPDGSGLDLMRDLAVRRPDPPPRAIALSGFGTDGDVARSREAGFADHLTKPVSLDKLKEAIGRVL